MSETKTPEEKAFDAAGRLLAHRARTEAEIRRRLAQKGFEDAVVEHTVSKLHGLALLDDAAFARERAQGLLRRGSGPRLVAARLSAAGVAPDAARAALEAALEAEGGEDAVARRALERRHGAVRGAEPDLRRKAAAFLVRRGFSPEVAGRAAGVFTDGEA